MQRRYQVENSPVLSITGLKIQQSASQQRLKTEVRNDNYFICIPDPQIKQKIQKEKQFYSPLIVNIFRNKQEQKREEDKLYKFWIGPGNNNKIVERVLKSRKEWFQCDQSSTLFNFRWTLMTKSINFDLLYKNLSYKQVVNHFEYHYSVSTKDNLIKNLKNYCQTNKLQISQFTPPTFTLDFSDENIDIQLLYFIKFYFKNLPLKDKVDSNSRKIFNELKKNLKQFYQADPIDSNLKCKTDPNIKPQMRKTFDQGQNLWILKPSGFNRGIGIHIFNSIQQLEQLLTDYLMGIEEKPNKKQQKKQGQYSQNYFIYNQNLIDLDKELEKIECLNLKKSTMIQQIFSNSNGNNLIKSTSFVIQKYIESPLLIKKRKFDIRVWILVTQKLDVYWFKEGYLRTCSLDYKTDCVENQLIHLTNNAIQKHGENYGEHEEGNILSFDDFKEILNLSQQDFQDKIEEPIKYQIKHSLLSVKDILNKNDRQFCFEIFGFDFILDELFNLYLIEINNNPSLEESSPLLAQLIPRMLDNAFQLTLDKIFPVKQQQQSFPFKNYPNNLNLFDFLINLDQQKKNKNKK